MEKVLLLCDRPKSTETLTGLLQLVKPLQITACSCCDEAKALLAQENFALVVVSLVDENPLESPFLSELCARFPCGVLLLVAEKNYAQFAAKGVKTGAMVLPKPVHTQSFSQAVLLGLGTFHRLQGFFKENQKLHSQIEQIKLVNRAKAVLIEYLKLSEPQAHRYIEKQAMDLGLSKEAVAQNILTTYES